MSKRAEFGRLWTIAGIIFTVLLLGSEPGFGQRFADLPENQRRDMLSNTPVKWLPRQDNQQLLEEELEKRAPGRAPKFAKSLEVDLDIHRHGIWVQKGDQWIWRHRIRSEGALSINLGFSAFHLPDGALLYLNASDGSEQYGPLSSADNEAHNTYWSPAIRSEEVLLELRVPAAEKKETRLTITTVNHDFIGLGRVLSGSCNLDVACSASQGWPLVDRYRDQTRAVGLITIDGSALCSGFLVNNTRNDCRPFFMTAEHCDIEVSNAPSVVVYWNYQNSYCRQPGSVNSGGLGNGVFNQVNSGAVWRAEYRPSDFTLLELDDPVIPEANAFFAGWSTQRSGLTDTVFSVHHPANEEKRISFEFDEVYLGFWEEGNQAFEDGDHVIVRNWEVGTTEEGSSGAPLFNKHGQVIGQLHGGRAACGNSEYDAFGWFGTSWEGEDHPTNSLKAWLDPDRTGVSEWAGHRQASCQKSLVVDQPNLPLCPGDTIRYLIELSEAFEGPVTLEPLSLPDPLVWADSTRLTAQPGGLIQPTIRLTGRPLPGNYDFLVRAFDATDTLTLTLQAEINYPPEPFLRAWPEDDQEVVPEEVLFQWDSSAYALRYRFELALDSAFNQLVYERIRASTSLTVNELAYHTAYFWRVTAESACGQIRTSTGRFRTGPNVRLDILEAPLRVCSTEVVQYTLGLGVDFGDRVVLEYETDFPEAVEVDFRDAEDGYFRGGQEVVVGIRLIRTAPGEIIPVRLIASEGERRSQVVVQLRQQGLPVEPQPLQPENGAIQLPGELLLEWLFDERVNNYQLRVSRDEALQDIVEERSLRRGDFLLEQELTAGTYYWQLAARTDCGAAFSEVRSFTIQSNGLGKLNATTLAIEPNPAQSRVNIHLSRPLDNATISLYSLTGALIRQVRSDNSARLITLQVDDVPTGMYIVRVQQRQASISRRVIVAH